MKHTCRHSQALCMIALLLFVTLLFAGSSAAQDFQIMVSGPWAYVVDPSPQKDPNSSGRNVDRIVLVGPYNPAHHHSAYIFGGSAANRYEVDNHSPIAGSGLHYLDFNSTRKNDGKLQANEQPPLTYANQQPVSSKRVSDVLYNNSIYAISLPAPDYYSTYSGDATVDGYSESKVDTHHITPSTPAKDYTTWMVLHYSVTSIPASVDLTGPNTVINTLDPNTKTTGISIVLGAPLVGSTNNPRCDSYSAMSFVDSTNLWGLTQYVRFPEVSSSGGPQKRGYYHYDCNEIPPDDLTAADSGSKMTMRSGAGANLTAKKEEILSAGGADCHSAQMSINGAVMNALVP